MTSNYRHTAGRREGQFTFESIEPNIFYRTTDKVAEMVVSQHDHSMIMA